MKAYLIDGGIGRVICTTGIIPKNSIIITPYPSIFLGNPNIKELYGINTEYLVEKIFEKNIEQPEPYLNSLFYRDKKHLISMFNLLINGKDEYIKPIIYIDELAEKRVLNFLKEMNIKKYILFQPLGSNIGKDSLWRGFPIKFIQKSIELMNKKGYSILYMRGKNAPMFENVIELTEEGVGLPELFAFTKHADKIIGCDSCVHHIAAALNKQALVFWTGTDIKNFGHPTNINIKVGEPMKHIFRVPLNDPNRLNFNPYDWNDNLLIDINNYIK